MKSRCLAIVIICMAISGFAQKIRFTDTSNHWKLLLVVVDAPGAYYTDLVNCSYGNDTAIAGANYHLMSSMSFIDNSTVAVREDGAQGQIHFRVPGSADTAEHLLFDYGLQTGDTLKVSYGKYAWEHQIQSIDSILIGGVYHRRWRLSPVKFSPPYPPSTYDFIEGLGTQYGPTFGMYPSVFEHGYQLRCFTTNGLSPTCNPPIDLPFSNITRVFSNNYLPAKYFDNDLSCQFSKALSVGNTGETDQQIQFSPNPGNSEMTLTIPSNISKGMFRVSEMTGRTCLELELNNRKTNIGQYLSISGVYTYSLQDAASGKRYSGRFIIR